MQMAISGKQLAELLGTSEATVSMALNGKPGVSDKKREEIIRFAKEKGYDFSRLKNTYTESVHLLVYLNHGAIIGDTPFFKSLFESAEAACNMHQLNLYLRYVTSLFEVTSILRNLSSQLKCGVILLGTEMSKDELLAIQEINIPVIVLDTTCNDVPLNYVAINNRQGAFNATMHLIEQFKTQPGYLRSSYEITNFVERGDGFYRAIRTVGMSPSRSVVHYLSPSIEGAYLDMLEILKNDEPTAKCYFADNDLIAAGAMKAFTEMGYKIPKDVGFFGFDNISLCTLMMPTLSSVDVPKSHLSSLAIERLVEIMETPKQPPISILLTTQLICRNSSKLKAL